MVLRPDEKAVESEIERDQQVRSTLGKAAKTAASAGTAVALGPGGVGARVLPFLNKLIPAELAMKGLSKVSPKIANFLKRGQSLGLNVEEGIQYLRDSIKPNEEKPEKPKDNRNIIEQYSPELHQFISQEVSGGRTPIEAAAVAQNDKRFSEVIKKLSKDHNTPWSSIIDSIYGTGQYGGAVNPPNAKQEALKKFSDRNKRLATQETERFENTYGADNQQKGGAPGPGQKALMDILNKINQKLGQ